MKNLGISSLFFPVSICLAMLTTARLSNAASTNTPPTGPLIRERIHSLYNDDLTVLDHEGKRFLFAQSRLGGVIHSAMDLGKKDQLILDYLQVMAMMTALHSHPENIYNLGLGGGELIRFHLHRYEKSRIDSAEIDPTVIQVAKKYFEISSPRHQILEGEGFDLLKKQKTAYDIIWVDDVVSKEGPKAYIKAERLKALREKLAEGGILVVNLGEARKQNSFEELEREHLKGYSHGIRVKSPIPHYAQNVQALRLAALPGRAAVAPVLLPAFLIAVGNQPSLTCARFWEIYLKWTEKGLVSVKWDPAQPEHSRELCEDLKSN